MATDLQPRPFAFDTTRRYTIEEYYRLVEAGLLDEDARVELLDGRIVPMAPIGPEHQWVVDALIRAFLEQEKGRFRTSQGRPLPIPVWSVPEPDLMLYRIGAAHRQRHVQPEDVFLVVEVAQSTRRRDLNKKAKLYRSAGVPEYWVVDLKQNGLHVFALEGDGYKETLLEQGSASPRAFPDVTIDLGSLFGDR
jgi:Uma2 family endonuclease